MRYSSKITFCASFSHLKEIFPQTRQKKEAEVKENLIKIQELAFRRAALNKKIASKKRMREKCFFHNFSFSFEYSEFLFFTAYPSSFHKIKKKELKKDKDRQDTI